MLCCVFDVAPVGMIIWKRNAGWIILMSRKLPIQIQFCSIWFKLKSNVMKLCDFVFDPTFSSFLQARLFDEPQLASLCLDTIDKSTADAINAEGFTDIDLGMSALRANVFCFFSSASSCSWSTSFWMLCSSSCV